MTAETPAARKEEERLLLEAAIKVIDKVTGGGLIIPLDIGIRICGYRHVCV